MKIPLSEAFLVVALSGAVFVFVLGVRLTILVTFSDVNIVHSDPMKKGLGGGSDTPPVLHETNLKSQPQIPDFTWKKTVFKNISSKLGQQTNSKYSSLKTPWSDLEARFPILPTFTFPQPETVQPVAVVAKATWIHDLRVHLHTFQHKQINMVTSNIVYTDVLLNWLIAATVRSKIPLSSILVFSLNSNLHEFLRSKHMPSVFLPPNRLLNPNFNFTREFDKVMMIRLSMMRLLNHFGFDIANYDTDAIILQDPQALYEHLSGDDIIGSVGWIPKPLYDNWGVTICIGVVLLRSSRKTEEYWHSVATYHKDCYDDQLKLNYGLEALDILWSNNVSSYNTTTIHGKARNGLQVSILPLNRICRLAACTLEKRNHLYIWHKGGSRNRKNKLDEARQGQTWFLRFHWNMMKDTYTLTGVEWLSSIAYYMTTHT